MAPEYALLGQLTKKADVYSFGILVLEVISGGSSSRAAFTDELLVLVEWVKLMNSNTLTHNIYISQCKHPKLCCDRPRHFTRYSKNQTKITKTGSKLLNT